MSADDDDSSDRIDSRVSLMDEEPWNTQPYQYVMSLNHIENKYDEDWLNHQCAADADRSQCEICMASTPYDIAVRKLFEAVRRNEAVDPTMPSSVAIFGQDDEEQQHQQKEEHQKEDNDEKLEQDQKPRALEQENSSVALAADNDKKNTSALCVAIVDRINEITSAQLENQNRIASAGATIVAPSVTLRTAAVKPKWVHELEHVATYDPTPIVTTLRESHNATDMAKLRNFQAFLDKGFVNQTVGTDEDRYLETVMSVIMWKDDDDDDDLKEPFNDNDDDEHHGFYLLSLEPYEKAKVSHNMLHAIMFKAASILKVEHLMMMAHDQCHDNMDLVQGSEDDQENHVEYMIQHVYQHLRKERVLTVDVPSEFNEPPSNNNNNNKTAVRNYEKLHRNGVNKTIRRLSRNLMHAIGFGGIGKDSIVRGAVVTLISVEIVEMELRRAGTSQSQIFVRSTGNYPLFSKAATLALLGNQSRPSDYDRIFPETANFPIHGFNLLAELMLPHTPSIVFASGEAFYCDKLDSQEGQALTNYLGSGAFSNVYELTDGGVIKVPKEPRYNKDLEDEMNILKNLNDDCIPKAEAENLGFLKVHIRCEVSTLKCLRLTGVVGESASNFVFKSLAQLAWVCCEVGKALDHAHGVGIAHLDVHPCNIIVAAGGPNNPRVQLIDWGLAEPFQNRLSGFRGTAPYAHDILLVSDTTEVETKEDDCWMEIEKQGTTSSETEREALQEEVKPGDELESDDMNEETATTEVETDHSTKDQIMTRDGRWFPSPRFDFASLAYTVTTIIYRMKTKSPPPPWDGLTADEMELSELEPRRHLVQMYLGVLDGDLGGYLRKMCCGAGIQYPISATDLPSVLRSCQE